jgi:hypothetical protein
MGNELEALIEKYRDVGQDPLEAEKDPEEVCFPRGLGCIEPADIRMNALSVAFGGKADFGAQNPTCYMCCLTAEPIRQNDP